MEEAGYVDFGQAHKHPGLTFMEGRRGTYKVEEQVQVNRMQELVFLVHKCRRLVVCTSSVGKTRLCMDTCCRLAQRHTQLPPGASTMLPLSGS